jgi:hypothetical protein
MSSSEPEVMTQPWIPRYSMRWYFIIVTAVALLVTIVYRSGNPVAWTFTLCMILAAIAMFLLLSAVCFLAAYSFGNLKDSLFRSELQTQSPFAHETMPPQIIPPQIRQ